MIYRRGVPLVIMIILTAIKMQAQDQDSIFLYNGQVLIGRMEGGSLGVVTFDDLDFRRIEVKLYKIKSLSTQRRFRIQLSNKEIIFGVLRRGSKDGWTIIETDDGKFIEVDINTINLIFALNKSFIQQLYGKVSTGFTYAKSSTQGQFNFASSIRFISNRSEYQFGVSAIGSLDSSKYSRDREDAILFVGYNMTPTWILASSLSYQRNIELSIARRYQEMVGAGNKLFIRNHWQLLAISGITFNQEKSTSGASSGLLLEVPLIFRFNFFKYNNPNIQVDAVQALYYSISQKNRLRWDSNISFSCKLIQDFYLTLNPYTNYDNQPPQGGSTFDYGLAVSITYTF